MKLLFIIPKSSTSTDQILWTTDAGLVAGLMKEGHFRMCTPEEERETKLVAGYTRQTRTAGK